MNVALLVALSLFLPGELATVTTEYDLRDEGRAWNIALAAVRIDGVVLRPGASFSFNQVVGPRGLGEGFRPAPELVDGGRVEGIGGGVCQVASTLYAAALEAGLTIVARQAHSRPSGYLPVGLDATVSSSRQVDLVLRNDATSPVRLAARAHGGRLSVSIDGTFAPPASLEIVEEPNAGGLLVTVLRAMAGGSPELVSRDVYGH